MPKFLYLIILLQFFEAIVFAQTPKQPLFEYNKNRVNFSSSLKDQCSNKIKNRKFSFFIIQDRGSSALSEIAFNSSKNFHILDSKHAMVWSSCQQLNSWLKKFPHLSFSKLKPHYKIQPELKQNFEKFQPAQLDVISYQANGFTKQKKMSLKDVTKLSRLASVYNIELSPKIKSALTYWDYLSLSNVATGSPAAMTGYETGTKIMNFPAAWSRGFSGQRQLISIADTGLDFGSVSELHPDFQKKLRGGFDFVRGNQNIEDTNGHGTHVAGSALGSGVASNGVIRGGAFAANVYVQKLWSQDTSSLVVPLNFKNIFKLGWDLGSRIQVGSWGDSVNRGAYTGLSRDIDDFIFQFPDYLIVLAAGNSGIDANSDGRVDAGSIFSPATSKNALVVGASENFILKEGVQRSYGAASPNAFPVEPLRSDLPSNNARGLAAFSARGPTADGRIKPDLVAPGTNILSTCSRVPNASVLWGRFGDQRQLYCWGGGTSSSAPLVAGAAALVRESLMRVGFAKPSASLVKAVLMSTARDLFPGQFGNGPNREISIPRPNSEEGFGLVDLDIATRVGTFFLRDDLAGVGQGQTIAYDIKVETAGRYSILMIYTDPPGSPMAPLALVNDLDLHIVDGATKKIIKRQDKRNNFEFIELNLKPGSYKFIVYGTKVWPQFGKQRFSFVFRKL